jgi:hypothetical protein
MVPVPELLNNESGDGSLLLGDEQNGILTASLPASDGRKNQPIGPFYLKRTWMD